jgi:hypothetical protein
MIFVDIKNISIESHDFIDGLGSAGRDLVTPKPSAAALLNALRVPMGVSRSGGAPVPNPGAAGWSTHTGDFPVYRVPGKFESGRLNSSTGRRLVSSVIFRSLAGRSADDFPGKTDRVANGRRGIMDARQHERARLSPPAWRSAPLVSFREGFKTSMAARRIGSAAGLGKSQAEMGHDDHPRRLARPYRKPSGPVRPRLMALGCTPVHTGPAAAGEG